MTTLIRERRSGYLTLCLLAVIWWALTLGSVQGWLVGLPSLALAYWVNRRFRTISNGFSLIGLVRFIPFFLWESLRGGVDVASRTLSPRMRVRPGFVVYRMRLQNAESRNLFTSCVSLLPGSLAADLKDDCLEVHLINQTSDYHTELKRLERAVGRVFPNQEEHT